MSSEQRNILTTLDELDYEVSVESDGTRVLNVKFDDGRYQAVFISAKTDSVCGVDVRDIWSPAFKAKRKITDKLAYELLCNNRHRVIGSWVLDPDENLVYFSAKMPDSISAKELDAVIIGVASDADRLEKKLDGNDNL